MEVPDEDTSAAQLSSSTSSVGRARYETAKDSRFTAEAALEGKAAEAAAGETHASNRAPTAGHTTPAAESSAQTGARGARPPDSKGGAAPGAVGDKKIPPGAVRMLSMTTVEEFQKKVAERRGRVAPE